MLVGRSGGGRPMPSFAPDLIQDRADALLEKNLAQCRDDDLAVLRSDHVAPQPFALGVYEQELGDTEAAIRMLEFETWMDGAFISQHRADGMIVCTPTGSTAYALSGGGPVLHPGLEAFALVPICPHTLSDRPIVVGSRHTVRIVLGGDEGTRAMFTCDGQVNETLDPGDAVEITRAEESLQLIHPSTHR